MASGTVNPSQMVFNLPCPDPSEESLSMATYEKAGDENQKRPQDPLQQYSSFH